MKILFKTLIAFVVVLQLFVPSHALALMQNLIPNSDDISVENKYIVVYKSDAFDKKNQAPKE